MKADTRKNARTLLCSTKKESSLTLFSLPLTSPKAGQRHTHPHPHTMSRLPDDDVTLKGAPPPPPPPPPTDEPAAPGGAAASREPGAHRAAAATHATPHAELTHPKDAAASAAARHRDEKAQGHTGQW